jgi:murein DD-endopeptidase MepM/ murein hydrolase activator NlpD
MVPPRLTLVPLVLMLSAGVLAACVRHAPPAPVGAGQVSGSTIAPAAAPGAAAPPHAASSGMWAAVPHPDHVVVQPHETVYAIARRYDVPVRSLIEANGLGPPYKVTAGRRLIVPQIRQHIVQPGETLYSVSRLYGVDASMLARANDLAPPYTVRAGEALILPAPVQMAAVTMAEPAPPALAPIPVTRSALPPPLEQKTLAPETRPPAQIEPAAGPSRQEMAALQPPSPPPLAGPRNFIWPVHGRVIASYGAGSGGTHNDGVNIAARAGTVVVAAESGTVAYAGNELRGYGNLVLIKHANGWMTAYAHNSALLVKRGEKVRRGQPIARIGTTGAVGEPQLHFEIRRGTKALDPVDYLPAITAASASG